MIGGHCKPEQSAGSEDVGCSAAATSLSSGPATSSNFSLGSGGARAFSGGFGQPKPSSGSASFKFNAKPSEGGGGCSGGFGQPKPSSGSASFCGKPSRGGAFSFGQPKPSGGAFSGGLRQSSGSPSFGANPTGGGAFSFGERKPSGGAGFSFPDKPQMPEGVNVSFSFQDCEKRVPQDSYSSCYIWGEQGNDLLPADGESALRQLSNEDIGLTGPYGSLLHLMAARYKAETVEAALGLFPDSALSVVDEHGQTVLHAMAAYGASMATLERVLQRTGTQILASPNLNGALPLHVAAQKSLGMVPRMLEGTREDVLASKTAQGATVLHLLAESRCSTEVMQTCIARLPKECLLQKDAFERTPAHMAVEAGSEAVLLLLEAAPVDVLLMEDDRGLCILEVALLQGRLGSAFSGNKQALLTLIDIYVKNGVMERKKEWRTISPLHAALGRCEKAAVTALLGLPQAKKWLSTCDPVTGVLPIHFMVWRSSMTRRFDLVPILDMMTPEDVVRPIVGSNTTALHLAVMRSDGPFGQQLLDAAGGAFDVDAVDAKGRSLFALAMTMGQDTSKQYIGLLERILAMSASRTPLTVAGWRGVGEQVDVSLLLAICARYENNFFAMTVPDDWEGGMTPLHCACYYLRGDTPFEAGDDKKAYKRDLAALLELLPEWFVTVRYKGRTPLHIAAEHHNTIAVELLLGSPSGPKAATMVWYEPSGGERGIPLQVALRPRPDVEVVRLFLAIVPGIRSVSIAGGQTLSEFVDGLHASDPHNFADIKAAFAPTVKSAAQ